MVRQGLETDSYKIYEFSNNLGYIDEKIPDDVYKTILEEIDTAFTKKNPHNKKLVGNIEEQYYMSWEDNIKLFKVENYLRGLAGIYEQKFKYMSCMGNQSTSLDEGMSYDLRLRQCWVNYMKKYEFNPLHNHSGLYSFVVFVKIPFDLRDEFKSARTRNPNQRISKASKTTYEAYANKLGITHVSKKTIPEEWLAECVKQGESVNNPKQFFK